MVLPVSVRCDRTPAWAALREHFNQIGRHFDLRQAFASDAQRFDRFSQQAPMCLLTCQRT